MVTDTNYEKHQPTDYTQHSTHKVAILCENYTKHNAQEVITYYPLQYDIIITYKTYNKRSKLTYPSKSQN